MLFRISSLDAVIVMTISIFVQYRRSNLPSSASAAENFFWKNILCVSSDLNGIKKDYTSRTWPKFWTVKFEMLISRKYWSMLKCRWWHLIMALMQQISPSVTLTYIVKILCLTCSPMPMWLLTRWLNPAMVALFDEFI